MNRLPARTRISAGGVIFRRRDDNRIDVAIVAVGSPIRWQLPGCIM